MNMIDTRYNLVFLIAIVAAVLSQITATEYQHKRYEYKHSFKGPHLVDSQGRIPFWTFSGDAIPSKDQLRLVPSIRSKRGMVWSNNVMSSKFWEVQVLFKVTGRGRVGADGLALWFTENQGNLGAVFGSEDRWKGLGIFFDSFDNDGQHNNPYVMAVINDGTKTFDHASDGSSQAIGGCMRDYRNRPFPVKAVIRYEQSTLSLLLSNGLTDEDGDLEVCFTADNVDIHPNGYFGASAATGGLADDHDIVSYQTWTLTSQPVTPKVADFGKEAVKSNKEYTEFSEEFEKRRDRYKKEHPEKFREEEEGIEGHVERNFLQLLSANHELGSRMMLLLKKFDSLSESLKGSGGSNQQNGMQSVSQVQKDLINDVKNLKATIDNINNKVGGGGQDAECKRNMDKVSNEVAAIKALLENKNQQGGDCPTVSCIGMFGMSMLMLLQVGIVIGFSFYQRQKAAAAKKFF